MVQGWGNNPATGSARSEDAPGATYVDEAWENWLETAARAEAKRKMSPFRGAKRPVLGIEDAARRVSGSAIGNRDIPTELAHTLISLENLPVIRSGALLLLRAVRELDQTARIEAEKWVSHELGQTALDTIRGQARLTA